MTTRRGSEFNVGNFGALDAAMEREVRRAQGRTQFIAGAGAFSREAHVESALRSAAARGAIQPCGGSSARGEPCCDGCGGGRSVTDAGTPRHSDTRGFRAMRAEAPLIIDSRGRPIAVDLGPMSTRLDTPDPDHRNPNEGDTGSDPWDLFPFDPADSKPDTPTKKPKELPPDPPPDPESTGPLSPGYGGTAGQGGWAGTGTGGNPGGGSGEGKTGGGRPLENPRSRALKGGAGGGVLAHAAARGLGGTSQSGGAAAVGVLHLSGVRGTAQSGGATEIALHWEGVECRRAPLSEACRFERCPKPYIEGCEKQAADLAILCFNLNVARGIDRIYARWFCNSKINRNTGDCLRGKCPP